MKLTGLNLIKTFPKQWRARKSSLGSYRTGKI